MAIAASVLLLSHSKRSCFRDLILGYHNQIPQSLFAIPRAHELSPSCHRNVENIQMKSVHRAKAREPTETPGSSANLRRIGSRKNLIISDSNSLRDSGIVPVNWSSSQGAYALRALAPSRRQGLQRRAQQFSKFAVPACASLLPLRLPPFARRIPDSRAPNHSASTPPGDAAAGFSPLRPQSPAGPSIPPPCVPRFSSDAGNFRQPQPRSLPRIPGPALPRSSAQNLRASVGPRRKPKAAFRKNVFRGPTQTRTARHLPVHAYGSGGSLGWQLAERGVGRKRDLHEDTTAAHVHEHFDHLFRESSREAGNQTRSPVCASPPPSTRKQGYSALREIATPTLRPDLPRDSCNCAKRMGLICLTCPFTP